MKVFVLSISGYNNYFSNSDLFWLLIAILAIAVFIIAREVSLWYWGINKRIELLEEQNKILKNIFKQLGGVEELDSNNDENK